MNSLNVCEAMASVVALLKIQQYCGDLETKAALQEPINLIINDWGEYPQFDRYVRDYLEEYKDEINDVR